MLIYIPTAALFLYLLFRLVLPSRLSPKGKAAAGAALFLVAQSHLIKALFFGGLSAAELPPLVLLAQGWLFISLLIFCALTLAWDALKLVFWLKNRLLAHLARRERPVSEGRRNFLVKGLASVPVAVATHRVLASSLILAPTAYGVAQSVAVPRTRALELRLPRLPKALDGFTLAQVSDIHASPLLRRDWVEALADKVNGLNADLILITGDLVDGLPEQRADSVAPFRKLRAKHGVLACVGNHEYYGDFRAWMDLFPELGLRFLQNSHTVVDAKGGELVVAGLTDEAAGRFSLPGPDLQAALAGSPENAPRILMDHRPGNAALNARERIDLQLSGHTHGGHMPGMNRVVGLFNHGFIHGWYNVDGMPLYVNAGAGVWNGFPVRIGVPPEIARITLRAV